jgi:hypothetical protein
MKALPDSSLTLVVLGCDNTHSCILRCMCGILYSVPAGGLAHSNQECVSSLTRVCVLVVLTAADLFVSICMAATTNGTEQRQM